MSIDELKSYLGMDDGIVDPEFIIAKKNNKTESKMIKYKDYNSIMLLFTPVKQYTFKNWKEYFGNNKINLLDLIYNPSWFDVFQRISNTPYFQKIEKILCASDDIVPYPQLLFNAFNTMHPKDIKVVIIGQDPYINKNHIEGKLIPQATGLSFSVPMDYPTPPSLKNIFNNLEKFNHINKIPDTGCLGSWALQGVFLLNAGLTTVTGKSNSHVGIWTKFIDDILAHLMNNFNDIIFVAWGSFAHKLLQGIDIKKHHIITSSHPSPLSSGKTFVGKGYGKHINKDVKYLSFMDIDHFGEINKILIGIGKTPIKWDLIF
jgi:uracil-DNA glycosylase